MNIKSKSNSTRGKVFNLEFPAGLSFEVQKTLAAWYAQNARQLPWRKSQDPYRIWISEVMLQQTTVTAVIPYFERFLKRFPTLDLLAKSTIEDVYSVWTGLGYYSRARNLHRAAQILNQRFPETYQELLEIPGFGPYTSRSVASLAFNQAAGVVDGNVIRVLSRYAGVAVEHWKNKERDRIQKFADLWVVGTKSKIVEPAKMNQALMELGATICTPQSPTCLLCPLQKTCVAFRERLTEDLPLKKPRKAMESYLWTVHLSKKGTKLPLIKNTYAPFLKDQWIWPGTVEKIKKRPKAYELKGTITHHQIFICLAPQADKRHLINSTSLWIAPEELTSKNPASILARILSQWSKQQD